MKRTLAIVLAMFAGPSGAGELVCSLSCDLGGISPSVEWKPSSSCYKPSLTSVYFVRDVKAYNMAVTAFNRWLDELDRYLTCVQNEAKSDLKKMPDILTKGVNKVQAEVDNEISNERQRLRMLRP